MKSQKDLLEQFNRMINLINENLFSKYGYIDFRLKATQAERYNKILNIFVCYNKNITDYLSYPLSIDLKVSKSIYKMNQEQIKRYKQRFSK